MPAEILRPTADNIARAAAALRAGRLVAMPTETVYGLAGLAFDDQALAAIFAAKERPTFDPLICHVAQPAAKTRWLDHLDQQGLIERRGLSEAARERVEKLAAAFWPGPLTMVLPKQPGVPDLATSGLPTVGVRSPRHPVAQQLLAAVGQPLAAPSANRFGRISPTSAAHVLEELGERMGLILDGGACEIGIESTVVLVEPAGAVLLLRPGGIAKAQLERVLDIAVNRPASDAPSSTPLPSPGLLASHYAPRKPLSLLPQPLIAMSPVQRETWRQALQADVRIGLLLNQPLPAESQPWLPSACVVEALSPSGEVSDAARHLFAGLRALDAQASVDEIWAELWPDETGLGFAINDRLRKASHR